METSADYFGSTPELNVFTHTWSLGVEEQFYFIYPILFWFIYKSDIAINNRFSLTSNVILILTLLSLIAYILLWPINPIAAFYLIFTRFWELGAGCLAYLSIEPAIKKISLYKYDNYYVSEILFIGLFILLSIPDKYIVFSTIASVLLTTLLISINKPTGNLYKFLSNKYFLYVGIISFSLYLWHWIVISISQWTIGISFWSLPFQFILIFVFAICSYHCIELPLRTMNWNSSKIITITLGLASSMAASIMIFIIYLSGGMYLGEKYPVATAECSNNFNSPYWIVGDSHAGIYSSVFSEITGLDCMLLNDHKSTGNSFLFSRELASKSNIDLQIEKPLVDVILKNPNEFIELIKTYKPELLFIAIYWNGYFLDNSVLHPSTSWNVRKYISDQNTSINLNQAILEYTDNLKEVALSVQDSTELLLLLPEPDFNWTPFGARFGECEPQWFNLNSYPEPLDNICSNYINPAEILLETHKARIFSLNKTIMNTLEGIKNIHFIDTSSLICEEGICSTHKDKKRLYMDDDHLGFYGLELIKPMLTDSVKENIRH